MYVKAFLSVDIPLNKLSNPEQIVLFEKYAGRRLPEQSTLRKSYVEEAYQATLNKIRKNIRRSYLDLIDKSTDVERRFIVNVIVGKLLHEEPSRSYWIQYIF